MLRRRFLKNLIAASAGSAVASVCQAIEGTIERIWPSRPRQAFSEESLEPAFSALFGEREITESDKVKVVAAKLAENGAVVPVKVETEFEHATQITIIASKNPVPLVAQFHFHANVKPFVATRIKLAESSEVIAVVETADGLFQARRYVEVTIGGCSA
ncbi:MAG: thiosulfate oxidation carrier protein SoxY [Pseudomonadota bacterium]